MNNLRAPYHKGVCDQSAVTAPPQRLGAHQAQVEPCTYLCLELVNCLSEFRGVHVVGIIPESLHAPRRVARDSGAARPPPASELITSELIGNAETRQIAFETVAGELRIPL
jgi:hypothetical protein